MNPGIYHQIAGASSGVGHASSSPKVMAIIGGVTFVSGIAWMLLRDLPYYSYRTRRSTQNKPPGVSYYISRWFVPPVLILVGFILLAVGLSRLL